MEATLYEQLGDKRILQLVNHFYDLVFKHPQIASLFKTDKEVIKQKQILFLTQFLGGPPLYSEKYGHPKLRARHLPHPISSTEAEAWLECMAKAIHQLDVSESIKDELLKRFIPTAMFMINKDS